MIEPRDGLLQRTLHTIRADNKIRVEHLTGRERDARPACKDRVRPHVAYGGAEADARTGERTGGVVEHRVVVCAIDLVVLRAVVTQLTPHVRDPAGVPNVLARVVLSEDDRGGLDGGYTQGGPEAAAEKKPRRVGRDIDSRPTSPSPRTDPSSDMQWSPRACMGRCKHAWVAPSAYGLLRGCQCLRRLRYH